MSVVSSRVSSVSSILKSIGGKSQVAIQSSRATYFKPPKDIKTILYNFETGKGHKEYKELICVLRDAVIKVRIIVKDDCSNSQCKILH